MRKRPVAVLDACVLVPMPIADTLLRLAEPPGLYHPRWTEEILAEMTRTLTVRFGKAREKAVYRQSAMRTFFPDAMVAKYERLITKMTNHPKDRHVLAAALACHADYLVTFNLRDFRPAWPPTRGLKVVEPSTFLRLLAGIDRKLIERRLREQAAAIDISVEILLDRLSASVPDFVATLRRGEWDAS